MTSVLSLFSLPDGWIEVPFRAVAEKISESGFSELEPLSVFLDAGVVPRSSREDNHNQLGESLEKYQRVQPNDIVFNKLRTWQGGFGISNFEGIVSPAYIIARPDLSVIEPRFLNYLLKSKPYLAELTRLSKWMPPTQFDISWESIRDLKLRIPPIEQQRKIADYLENQIQKTNLLCQKRRSQIELLNESKESCIVAAFSQFPKRIALKRVVNDKRQITYGIVQAGENFQDGVPYIRPVDMTDRNGVLEESRLLRTSPTIAASYKRSEVFEGDLVCSIGPSYGKVMIVPKSLNGANLTQGTARIAVKSSYSTEAIYWWLQSREVRDFWFTSIGGATFSALNLGPLSETPVPVISFSQGEKVASDLKNALDGVDSLIEKLSDSLIKHEELLTSIITSKVSGNSVNPTEGND